MRKQKNSMLVLVIITVFTATMLFLLGLSDGNGARGNRFLDLGDGTVRDTSTGLIWLKNANCFGRKNWDDAMDKAASLASGHCGLTDGSVAGDWRLPTKEEWQAFIDRNYTDPALCNAEGTDKWSQGDAFDNVQFDSYWSSMSDEADTAYAWGIYMSFGDVLNTNKAKNCYVWPVRGGN